MQASTENQPACRPGIDTPIRTIAELRTLLEPGDYFWIVTNGVTFGELGHLRMQRYRFRCVRDISGEAVIFASIIVDGLPRTADFRFSDFRYQLSERLGCGVYIDGEAAMRAMGEVLRDHRIVTQERERSLDFTRWYDHTLASL